MKTTTNHNEAMKRMPLHLPFTASALRGEATYAYHAGRLAGEDLAAWREHGADATYTVWSYATPIAWWNRDRGWYVVQQKFSPTTSKHQTYVRRALTLVGV